MMQPSYRASAAFQAFVLLTPATRGVRTTDMRATMLPMRKSQKDDAALGDQSNQLKGISHESTI